MLDRQYRMAQRIQAFASQEFYDGRSARDGRGRGPAAR